MTKPCRYCQQIDWGKHSCNRCGGERPKEIGYHGPSLIAAMQTDILCDNWVMRFDTAEEFRNAHMNRGMR